MKVPFYFFVFFFIFISCETKEISSGKKNIIALSQKYLESSKRQKNTQFVQQELANIEFEDLLTELNSDNKKITFWLNIYNASTLSNLRQNPKHLKDRNHFFNLKQINIAGNSFSLNEIENNILRRKIGKNPIFKKLKVNKLDPRIHFALNCGAKSCPPILFYSFENIQEELDLSTKAYLEIECEIKEGKIYLPMIFSWFEEDFGGKDGVFNFLRKYDKIQSVENPEIIYLPFDWTLSL
ncbi:MAG: DUF547 domain-containing protein [Flavobacteriia bacterium]|jgi:hypothetical protein